jgi:hypothetical protein
MWRVRWSVLAHQNRCDVARKTSNSFFIGIYQPPSLFDVTGLGHECFVHRIFHFSFGSAQRFYTAVTRNHQINSLPTLEYSSGLMRTFDCQSPEEYQRNNNFSSLPHTHRRMAPICLLTPKSAESRRLAV